MNLVQLKGLCEIVDNGLRISDAAKAIFRSQPSVTRQLQELENELGFEIFVRRRNRILAVTPRGEEVVALARSMLQDAENMRRLGAEVAGADQGSLTIATTHSHARYTLPGIIQNFVGRYPKVELRLMQGSPSRCCELVATRQADFAICTEPTASAPHLIGIPCYRLTRSVVVPEGHSLLARPAPITLADLAAFPLITYDRAYSGRQNMDQAFAAEGLHPNIVLSAVDADVTKIYVRMSLGIGIFASIVYDPKQDFDIRAIDARHLFESNSLNLFIRRRSYLREYMHTFLSMFAPHVKPSRLKEAILSPQAELPPISDLPELSSVDQLGAAISQRPPKPRSR